MTILSESASNVIENLACRLACRQGGRVHPHSILPFLPISLGLAQECLDDMADGSSVLSEMHDGLVSYEFSAYHDSNGAGSVIEPDTCVACGKDVPHKEEETLCGDCTTLLHKELNSLAETTGWPAQAVYEHEILYHAAKQADSIPAESLAGVSRYTLKSMRRKLDKLSVEHYARQKLDEKRGLMTYAFPALNYPRYLYLQNMAVIRSHPASIMEEVQLKVVRILLTLGLMFLGMVGLAIFHLPFPLMLIAGPAVAMGIWRQKDKVPEE